MKVKELATGIIYDVVDTYNQGYIIEKSERGYRYTGHLFRDFEVVDDTPVLYVKKRVPLMPKILGYAKTRFINKEFTSGKFEIAEDTITVYKNVVIFYSPAIHQELILDIAKSPHSGNRYVWGFEKHEDGTISLTPSIRMTYSERSEHFFIRHNKVVGWQPDSYDTIYVKAE